MADNPEVMGVRAVWKFCPAMMPQSFVQMPKGAEVLTVAVQYDVLTVWALVDPDPDVELEARQFDLIATGQPLDAVPSGRFVGTVFFQGGDYVFHVWDVNG